MNYKKKIDLYKLVSTSALLLMIFLVAWFFYHASSSGLKDGEEFHSFIQQCEADGGEIKLQKDSNGWTQTACYKNDILVYIK